MTTPTRSPPRPWSRRLLWGLKGLVALVFLAAALQKLAGQPVMVKHFDEIGLGQGFRYLTAVLEALGAILTAWRRTLAVGLFLLCGICAGALVAQIGPLHGDLVHVFVLGALVMLIGAMEWTEQRRTPAPAR